MLDLKTLLDRVEIALECPHCQHQSQQVFGRLKTDGAFTCPACATVVTVDTSDVGNAVDSAQRDLENFTKSVNKTIKITL